jgi:hypothetical protein
MKSNGASGASLSITRRTAIGCGVASGLALASASTEEAFGKAPSISSKMSPELTAACDFAIKTNWKSGPGYWAVAYSGDNFTGDAQLIGDQHLLTQKPQAGTMPRGWGSKTGSIVVGVRAVLRLIHQVNGQDVHVTLLPHESMADLRTVGLTDDVTTWKLFPDSNLKPPY